MDSHIGIQKAQSPFQTHLIEHQEQSSQEKGEVVHPEGVARLNLRSQEAIELKQMSTPKAEWLRRLTPERLNGFPDNHTRGVTDGGLSSWVTHLFVEL